MRHWDFHPTVRSGDDRTFGERAADLMRFALGTWTFFLGFGVAMTVWITSSGFGTDPRPYFELNLCLSMLAGLQGSVLLIAAKRADRISAELAAHHLAVTEESAEVLADLRHMMTELDRIADPVVRKVQ